MIPKTFWELTLAILAIVYGAQVLQTIAVMLANN